MKLLNFLSDYCDDDFVTYCGEDSDDSFEEEDVVNMLNEIKDFNKIVKEMI